MDRNIHKIEVKTDMQEIEPLIAGLTEEGVRVSLTVTGNSMYPLFRHGKDRVVLAAVRPSCLKKGDIPLYRRKDSREYILHRVIRVCGGTYVTAGDAQTEAECGVLPGSIIAVAEGFCRGDRYISCRSLPYRMYSFLWTACMPVRRYLLLLHRRKECFK